AALELSNIPRQSRWGDVLSVRDTRLHPRSERLHVWLPNDAGVITGNSVYLYAATRKPAPPQVREVRAEESLTICPKHNDMTRIGLRGVAFQRLHPHGHRPSALLRQSSDHFLCPCVKQHRASAGRCRLGALCITPQPDLPPYHADVPSNTGTTLLEGSIPDIVHCIPR